MGKKKNHAAELKAYARRANLVLKYEHAVSEGPGHIKRFCKRAVINGEVFPIGVGSNEKEAKQNAAKSALRGISEKENQRPVTENAAKNPTAPVHQTIVTKLNDLRVVESTRLVPNNPTQCCSFVVGDKEYPAATGKTKKEAKEEAAKICSSKTTEDAMTPGKLNTGNSASEMTSTQQEISRFTSEFDSIVCLGKGAFGHVFKAKEKLTEKNYAIKIVRCKEKALREVKALSDLHHSNILRYYTCWVEDSGYQWDSVADSCSTSQSSIDNSSIKYLYIQMELCDTKTLRVWIDEKNTQNVKKSLRNSKRREESLTIAQQIVSGVEYIHSKMLIHRDLKPANIMFGLDEKVKIGDFGLVTAADDDDNDENLMERTVYKGTPSYMAPEQKSQKTYDQRVDIFALGLIYFELLWKVSSVHERGEVWGDVRGQKFPKGFSDNFPQELFIIRPMLCVKPGDRPEAGKLKTDLEEFTQRLKTQEIVRRGSRTV
ncbi:interferon-induced, double-stranded RNA-activated protein kinase-like [Enoplosus armatus]|uniref:interferon-induced, double-stranded RNA-activated protein kinase-like n=1 Tax=Enoplosus armatus TaxID=215367 RepID=UPI00399544D6